MAIEGLPPASASWDARNARLERLRPLTAVWLFAGTLFLGSFLMFLMEPMIAKMVLPLMGGAPMVWNTCVVFFQMTLLGGYACAHSAARLLGSRRHALAHAALLILPCAALPIALADSMTSSVASPLISLLLTLVVAIGLPFFALAASASGLQTWYAATDHPGAHDPVSSCTRRATLEVCSRSCCTRPSSSRCCRSGIRAGSGRSGISRSCSLRSLARC